jgi:selenocysteine-specific elongation factor
VPPPGPDRVYVVATAGHVDHGKSTLVRALTGMEPDRYEEERRRGLTIDLGYAWMPLDGEDLAFVDVPGHESFIATMLAGLGPAPAVMFVVAADEGWRRQSSEHLAAIDALGLRHGLLVVTRSDLADPGNTIDESLRRIADSTLGEVESVAVSGRTGEGLGMLRAALSRLVHRLPWPRTDGRVRLWVDRSFVVRGAGSVITGTLSAGRLAVGDELMLGDRAIHVRGLQSLEKVRAEISAVSRVALNLRGIQIDEIHRGDALLTPNMWRQTTVLDVRRTGTDAASAGVRDWSGPELPGHLIAHLGTAAVPVRLRRLDNEMFRLTLSRPLPVESGDRLVLRDPGRHTIVTGALVLDTDPPELRRRGAAVARARDLRRAVDDDQGLIRARLATAEVLRSEDLTGVERAALIEAGAREVDGWLIDPTAWTAWRDLLVDAVTARARDDALDPRLSLDAARHLVGAPDRRIVIELARDAGLAVATGWVLSDRSDLDDRTARGLSLLQQRLTDSPFAAPERPELDAWGLGNRELAAAERLGRIVRLAPDVVLLPNGPALAMRTLSALPQPFTTSEARQALGTTRRVAIPLLEHLDRRGWTQRIDANHRRVRR